MFSVALVIYLDYKVKLANLSYLLCFMMAGSLILFFAMLFLIYNYIDRIGAATKRKMG